MKKYQFLPEEKLSKIANMDMGRECFALRW